MWTETGPVSIEQVRVGDRVLSQNAVTGELGYRFVLQTTVRPPSKTTRLGVRGEEIVATLGHPIWVNGIGWLMAKECREGDRLHSVHGAVPIDYIKEGPEGPAYNLVVDGWNTYFVGSNRVLVHDNQPRRMTQSVLPGYVLD